MTKAERVDFSKYGKAFQEKLCQLILKDRMFCDQVEEVMDIQFLEEEKHRKIAEEIYTN